MELQKRKQNRLAEYDYSMPNAYFITICTAKRENLFWKEDNTDSLQNGNLSRIGCIVDRAIQGIPEHYPAIVVDHYVVMPNHIHLLLRISSEDDGRPMVAPTVSTAIQQMKGAITKQAGKPVWQKGFHDHVIRGALDYREIWEYIENNPRKWHEDCFYKTGE